MIKFKNSSPKISDVMALVLASGVAFAWSREAFKIKIQIGLPDFALGATSILRVFVSHVYYPVSPCFEMLSVTLLGLSLRKPRPSLRIFAKRPGWIACFTATIVMVTVGGLTFLRIILESKHYQHEWFLLNLAKEPLLPTACAVGMSWTTLGFTGQFCPEANWIDKIGRILGIIWICAIPLIILFGPRDL